MSKNTQSVDDLKLERLHSTSAKLFLLFLKSETDKHSYTFPSIQKYNSITDSSSSHNLQNYDSITCTTLAMNLQKKLLS